MSPFSVASKSVKKTVGHYSIVCGKHFCDRAENACYHFAKEPIILSEDFIACSSQVGNLCFSVACWAAQKRLRAETLCFSF